MDAIFGLSAKAYVRKMYPCLCFMTSPYFVALWYLPFSQLHVAGFQIKYFSHKRCFFALTPTFMVILPLIQVTFSTIKLTFTF